MGQHAFLNSTSAMAVGKRILPARSFTRPKTKLPRRRHTSARSRSVCSLTRISPPSASELPSSFSPRQRRSCWGEYTRHSALRALDHADVTEPAFRIKRLPRDDAARKRFVGTDRQQTHGGHERHRSWRHWRHEAHRFLDRARACGTTRQPPRPVREGAVEDVATSTESTIGERAMSASTLAGMGRLVLWQAGARA